MKTGRATWWSIAIPAAILIVLLGPLAMKRSITAQEPSPPPKTAEQAFKNIKVIKTMPAAEVQRAMMFIVASLGVDCSYCHTPPAMEKDDKPTKETARRMLAMVAEINKNFGGKAEVNCATCHRGHSKPVASLPLPSLSTPFTENNTSQPPLPTVDELLDRYIKALGGMAALDKVASRVSNGGLEVGGVHGTYELVEVAPNKTLLRGSLPAPMGDVQQGFDGTSGWVKNQNGVFDMSGEGLTQTRRESAFWGNVKLKDQFKLLSVASRERIDGREFYLVLGTRPDDQIERLYFDAKTGLLARRYWETPTYFGGLANMNDYDDYRKVGGVLLPFVIRRARSGRIFQQTISEYKLNVAVDDAQFKKPEVKK